MTWLRFEVSDHGPGLAPTDAESLIRPFSKFSARNTGDGGAGLGLAICHNFVEAMGGRIGCDTRDPGSVLWFELPCPAGPAAAERNPETAALTRAVGKSQRCLLVDDDPAGAMVTSHQLELLGFEVFVATCMAEALETAEQKRFDAFVLDYLLPDGDGPTLVGKLRQAQQQGAWFVALTANVEAVRESQSFHRLFDRMLAKPADAVTLGEALAGIGTVRGVAAPELRPWPVLDGLSPETVIAMSEAVEDQWQAFRDRPWRAGRETDRAGLAQLVERDRAHKAARSRPIEVGHMKLTPASRELVVGDRSIFLPPAETRLLLAFLEAANEVVSRDQLTRKTCGREWILGDRTVDVLVARLRRRIPAEVASIVTIHGTGYLLSIR